MRPVWTEIDLKAISYNVRAIKNLIKPGTLLMAVVKANAYNHGAVRVAETALKSGAERLGVALVEEGLELRGAGIAAPIHILSEVPADAADNVVKADLIPTVCSRSAIESLSKATQKERKTAKIHLKVNTGMSRLGIAPEEVSGFIDFILDKKSLELEGIFTHLAVADQPRNPFTNRQLESFNSVVGALNRKGIEIPIKHVANSAATILFPSSHMDMVRIGITMYGLHPGDATREKIRLKPALSLKARVAFIRKISANTGISYGLTYKPAHGTTIAVLPLGYADGYPRSLSNKSQVLIGGRRAGVVGTICMDQLMVDVGRAASVEVGSESVLIGHQDEEEISADELASILGTINYEIVCMISSRVPRIYLDSTHI